MIEANEVTYLRWLAKEHPDIYKYAISGAQAAQTTARELGYLDEYDDAEGLGWINFVVQAAAMAVSAVGQKKAIDKQVSLQKKALALSDAQAAADRAQALKLKLLDVNTERAKQGLPILDEKGNPIVPSSLPVPAALKPYTTASPTWIPGVPNVVTGGAAALLAVLLAKRAGAF